MTFPPNDWTDVFMYDPDDIVAGYRDWRPTDPAPGDNRSDGYRWGWINARRDHMAPGTLDGFERIRHAIYINIPDQMSVS